MSIAVLARKTKALQKNNKYHSKHSHHLNMTGRGGGIGLFNFTGKTRGPNGKCNIYNNGFGRCSSNAQMTTCEQQPVINICECIGMCKCYNGGRSRPSNQLSYRTYLNRKTTRSLCNKPNCTSGRDDKNNHSYCKDELSCDDKNGKCVSFCKKLNTWKQEPKISSSEMTEYKKQSALRAGNALEKRNSKNNKLIAKDPVCYKNDNNKSFCCRKIRGRLAYTRMSDNGQTVTKRVDTGITAGEQIAKRAVSVYKCPCSVIPDEYGEVKKITDCDIKGKENEWSDLKIERCKRNLASYCFPKPVQARATQTKVAGIGGRNICHPDGSIAVENVVA